MFPKLTRSDNKRNILLTFWLTSQIRINQWPVAANWTKRKAWTIKQEFSSTLPQDWVKIFIENESETGQNVQANNTRLSAVLCAQMYVDTINFSCCGLRFWTPNVEHTPETALTLVALARDFLLPPSVNARSLAIKSFKLFASAE